MNDDRADLIDGVRFTPRRLSTSYRMGDVDALLSLLLEAARAGRPCGPLVAQAVLPTVRLAEGYDIAEVDAFLAFLAAHDAVRADPSSAPASSGPAESTAAGTLAARISGARFKPVRLGKGYAMGEVDRFLDQLEVAARAGASLEPMIDTAGFSVVSFRESYDIGQVDDFLLALVGRSRPVEPPDAGVIEERSGWLSRTRKARG